MPRRLWVSLAMLVAGAGLLVTAQLAAAGGSSRSFTKGGVFRVGTTGASIQVDPQVAYITTAWWLEYATAAKLYNYPDLKGPSGTVLVARGRVEIHGLGPRQDVHVLDPQRLPVQRRHPGDCEELRLRDQPRRQSRSRLAGGGVHHRPEGHEHRRREGPRTPATALDVSGVRVRGNRLSIHLTRPDGTFMSKITMPFFQATSTKLAARP